MNQNDAAYQAANSKILEKSSNDVDNTLFFLRGCASIKILNFDQGISDLSRFLSDINIVSSKDKTDAYSLRATAYLKTGQLDEAQKDAQQIHENAIIQEVKKARIWLTYINSKQDNPTFRLRCYVKLIEICPFSLKFIENLTILALKKDNITYSKSIMTKGKSTLPEESRIMVKLLYSFLKVDPEYISELNTSTKSAICQHLQQQIKDYRSNLIKVLDCFRSKDFICASNYYDHCYQILEELPSKNTTHFRIFSHIKNFLEIQIKYYGVKEPFNPDRYDRTIECLEELIDPNQNSEILYFFEDKDKMSDDVSRNNMAKIQKIYLTKLNSKLKDVEKQKDSYSENDYNKKVTDIKNDIQEGEKKMEFLLNEDYDPLYSLFGLPKKAEIRDLKKAYKDLSKNHNINKKEMEKIDIAYEFLSACKDLWDDHFSYSFMGKNEINLTRTTNFLSSTINFIVGNKKTSYSINYGLSFEKCYMSYYGPDDSL